MTSTAARSSHSNQRPEGRASGGPYRRHHRAGRLAGGFHLYAHLRV